jgi:AcrR family transcriptional regulator
MKHKSESVSNRSDARARRTLAQIDDAFVQLLHGRSYQAVRVSDIAKKARIGRATFYAHYESKDSLLCSQFMRVIEPMIILRPDDDCVFDCTPLFAHILSARRLYRSFAGARMIRDCLENRFRTLLEQSSMALSVPVPAVSCMIASSLSSFLDYWLENDTDNSAIRMQSIWGTVVGGGLVSIRS